MKDVRIPVIGQGTATERRGRRIMDKSRDKAEVAAYKTGIDFGLTHIDTAERYSVGYNEELVGEAIKYYDRKDVFVTTKVWSTNLMYEDLIASMKGSLHRLGLDYVDLYLVHKPNPEVPLKETMSAMEYCAKEGYTRFIGVSNFSVSMMEEAQSHLKDHRLVANQVHYSLMEQTPAEQLLPNCQEKDVMLIAYMPLEIGKLAKPGYTVLDELAQKYGKTNAQVSLNWLISQKKVVAIPKAWNLDHLKENIGAVGWRLSDEDHKRLSESFRKLSSLPSFH